MYSNCCVTPYCALLALFFVLHCCEALPSKNAEESNPLEELLGTLYHRNKQDVQNQAQVSSVNGAKTGSIKPDITALREAFSDMSEQDLKAFTPPPITNPKCYVEVEVVQRFPGKCVMLGGRIPGCQAQQWLSVYSEDCVAPPSVSTPSD